MDLSTFLSEGMAARLTRPLSEGWTVAVPHSPLVSATYAAPAPSSSA